MGGLRLMVDSCLAFQNSGRLLHELPIEFFSAGPNFNDDAAEPELGCLASFIAQMG